jgi:DNA-binding NtrC family response regulator
MVQSHNGEVLLAEGSVSRLQPQTRQFCPLVPVVLASGREDDRYALESMLAGTAWQLIGAADQADALWALRQMPIPIVLCDVEFGGDGWAQALHQLRTVRRHACVIFLRDLAGGTDGFFEEVVERGGFDVLTRPLQQDDVWSTLLFAYGHCKAGALPRSHRQIEG